jgi:Zn-dependent peptidase ImmA (M78 family)
MEAEFLIYPRITAELINHKIVKTIRLFAKKALDLKINQAAITFDEIVGKLTDYETILTDKNCGGYYDKRNKIIAFSHNHVKNKTVLCHELSHFLQDDLNIDYRLVTLSECIAYEQQTEIMAYLLCKEMFNQSPSFNSYFKKEDHIFLRDWYKGWIQDDLYYDNTNLLNSFAIKK